MHQYFLELFSYFKNQTLRWEWHCIQSDSAVTFLFLESDSAVLFTFWESDSAVLYYSPSGSLTQQCHFHSWSERNILLGLKGRQKLEKRTESSFFRMEKNVTYRTEKNGVPNPGIIHLLGVWLGSIIHLPGVWLGSIIHLPGVWLSSVISIPGVNGTFFWVSKVAKNSRKERKVLFLEWKRM